MKYIKKLIAPILITILMIVYFVFYGYTLFISTNNIFTILLPIILIVWMIKVCIERIKEINGGEEDDLSQY